MLYRKSITEKKEQARNKQKKHYALQQKQKTTKNHKTQRSTEPKREETTPEETKPEETKPEQTNDPVSAFSPTLPLEIAGTELAYPRDQKLLDLYLSASTGEGSPSGEMNLVMPKTMSGPFFDKRLLFVEGRQPASDIPLYVQVNESGIKTIPLYTVGPDLYNGSGIMNLFVKQKTYFGTSSINAIPTIVGTGHIPLYIQGHGFLGSTSTTSTNFVIPNTLGSGTNTTTLTTRGYL